MPYPKLQKSNKSKRMSYSVKFKSFRITIKLDLKNGIKIVNQIKFKAAQVWRFSFLMGTERESMRL